MNADEESGGAAMKRVCFLLQVRKERVEDYLQAHQVWPEMLDAMRNVGIRDYSMFVREDGLLVGVFEAEDPEESLRKLGETEVSRCWQEHMAPFFESGSGDLEKGGPDWLKEYFHME